MDSLNDKELLTAHIASIEKFLSFKYGCFDALTENMKALALGTRKVDQEALDWIRKTIQIDNDAQLSRMIFENSVKSITAKYKIFNEKTELLMGDFRAKLDGHEISELKLDDNFYDFTDLNVSGRR